MYKLKSRENLWSFSLPETTKLEKIESVYIYTFD